MALFLSLGNFPQLCPADRFVLPTGKLKPFQKCLGSAPATGTAAARDITTARPRVPVCRFCRVTTIFLATLQFPSLEKCTPSAALTLFSTSSFSITVFPDPKTQQQVSMTQGGMVDPPTDSFRFRMDLRRKQPARRDSGWLAWPTLLQCDLSLQQGENRYLGWGGRTSLMLLSTMSRIGWTRSTSFAKMSSLQTSTVPGR